MRQGDKIALISLVAGFTVWSVGFVALYGLQALGCAYGWPTHRAVLILAYGILLAVLAVPAFWPLRSDGEASATLSVAALWANRAALGAGVLVFLPVTFTSTCV